MKRSIYILLMSCLLLSSCIGCATHGSDNTEIVTQPSTTVEPEDERISVKVGSENVGYVTIPNVEKDAMELDEVGAPELQYLTNGLSKDSVFGQSTIKYDGKQLFIPVKVYLSCLGSVDYVDSLFADNNVSEVEDKILTIDDYGGIDCPDFEEDEISVVQRDNGEYFLKAESTPSDSGAQRYTIIRLVASNGTYYCLSVSGWTSDKVTRGGEPVTVDALTSIAKSWEPSQRKIHVGIFNTYGIDGYATDIDGLTDSGKFALTNYKTMAFYTSNVCDLDVDNIQQACYGLSCRSFDVGGASCEIRQYNDFDGMCAEAEDFFSESYQLQNKYMGGATVNVYDVDGYYKVFVQYASGDFMLNFSTYDYPSDKAAIDKFIKQLNIQKECKL